MLSLDKTWLSIFYTFCGLLLACLFLSIYTENYYLLLIPPALLFIVLSVNDVKIIYFVLLFMIPLSTEVQLPNGFATDFPTEILIGGLMILFFSMVLAKPGVFDIRFLKNPLIFLLLIHYAWVLIASVFSSDVFVSMKFSLAKTWYLITFVFVTSMMVREQKDFKLLFWCLFIPLLFTIAFTLVRHAETGFTFQTVNTPMHPFFRNHVNYACMVAQMVPFTMLAIGWYKKGSIQRRWLILSLALMLVAIYFSYTRSAWLALVIALLMIPVVRWRLMKWVAGAGIIVMISFFVYMGYHNKYLDYSPDFETTVYHEELADHLASTFEGKDVSSAERIYRWVAGVRMWEEHRLTGFGPGNFHSFYKSFTVNSFRTWVSDNPEKSSVHNYFLLILTEQGVIGLLIFLLLTIGILIHGQRIYHQTVSKEEKRYVLAILLCLGIIYVNTFLSDLLETDKIGSFYFICIALLVNQDIRNKERKEKTNSSLPAGSDQVTPNQLDSTLPFTQKNFPGSKNLES